MIHPRIEHWEHLLATAIDTARAKPFVWGVHDCPTFAFETRMILTGGEDIRMPAIICIHNHFPKERHLQNRDHYRQSRAAALGKWRGLLKD